MSLPSTFFNQEINKYLVMHYNNVMYDIIYIILKKWNKEIDLIISKYVKKNATFNQTAF